MEKLEFATMSLCLFPFLHASNLIKIHYSTLRSSWSMYDYINIPWPMALSHMQASPWGPQSHSNGVNSGHITGVTLSGETHPPGGHPYGHPWCYSDLFMLDWLLQSMRDECAWVNLPTIVGLAGKHDPRHQKRLSDRFGLCTSSWENRFCFLLSNGLLDYSQSVFGNACNRI